MKKKINFASVVTRLLILLLFVCGIVVTLRFAGIGKDDIKDIITPVFRVEYGGEIYKTDTENLIALPESGEVRFEVKCANSYSVVIVPNVTAETDFSFTVNGLEYPYSGEKDLSRGFELTCYDNAFTINTDEDYTLESVLSKIWGTDNVTVSEHDTFPLYKLVVTSSSGEKIEILLSFYIMSITLPENIVF